MKKSILVIMVVILLSAQGAWAHHPWIEKAGDRLEVKWGHPPKAEPYEPGKVKDIKVFDKQGKAVKFERKDEKDAVYVSSKSDISMASIFFEGGYIVKTPDGYKKVTKQEAQKSGLQIADSFYYYQFAKALFANSDTVTKPVGMKFEIVPLENPFMLKAGQLLPIKVLFEGKPIENIAVKVGKEEVAKTDIKGLAQIQVGEKGMQIIVMTYRIPTTNNPDADFFSYTTVLTWDMK
jgi:nickel transport protein